MYIKLLKQNSAGFFKLIESVQSTFWALDLNIIVLNILLQGHKLAGLSLKCSTCKNILFFSKTFMLLDLKKM